MCTLFKKQQFADYNLLYLAMLVKVKYTALSVNVSCRTFVFIISLYIENDFMEVFFSPHILDWGLFEEVGEVSANLQIISK